MALKIVLTDAGRAALRNATANGTNAVTVAAVGLTGTAFTPDASTAAIPDEIKRVTTISGGTTAADTIHVTINDHSADSYSVSGIGVYLADATLLGSFSQADILVEKSAQATLLLAIDAQFADIDATQLVFGDTNFQLNQATTEALGVVELATGDETTAGTDASRVVTPAGLLAALNARLGNSAPSAFIKSLLTAASAALLRTALAIKGAALYDAGAGNGLDADLLDSQHGSYYLAWASQTGVPTSFPPSAHTHSTDDITSGALPAARGGTGVSTIPAGNYVVGNGTGAVTSKSPTDVLSDIGAAAKVHTHAISDINGLSDEFTSLTNSIALRARLDQANTFTGQVLLNNGGTDTPEISWQDSVNKTQAYMDISGETLRIFYSYRGGSTTVPWSISLSTGQLSLITRPRFNGATPWDSANLNPLKNGASNSSVGTILVSGAPPDIASIDSSNNSRNVALQISNGGNNAASAVIGFIREGTYGGFFGLDADNFWKVGGWSAGAVSYKLFHEGQLPAISNVSGLSTELAARVSRSEFTSSRASNGWAKLPDGTIMQWGVYARGGSAADGTTGSISFPMAFPNACFSVTATDRASSGGSTSNNNTPLLFGFTSSSFSWLAKAMSSGDWWEGMYWMAIGY